jgi:hypothetical protein
MTHPDRQHLCRGDSGAFFRIWYLLNHGGTRHTPYQAEDYRRRYFVGNQVLEETLMRIKRFALCALAFVSSVFGQVNTNGSLAVYLSSSSDVPVTTFTAETLICSLTIPAATMSGTVDSALSRLHVSAVVSSAGTSTATQFRIGIGPNNSLTGLNNLNLTAAATAGRTAQFDMYCNNRTATSQICNATAIVQTTVANAQAAQVPTNINVANNMFIVISAIQNVSGDTVTCRMLSATIY